MSDRDLEKRIQLLKMQLDLIIRGDYKPTEEEKEKIKEFQVELYNKMKDHKQEENIGREPGE